MPALLAVLAATTVAAAPCPGQTTMDMNACYAQRLKRADADLARYVAAAQKRLKDEAGDDAGVAKAAREFAEANAAWIKFRDAECGAVYDYWSGGTIRDVEALTCQISLTRQRTHAVWRNWLTYMDSTPPILPEPPVKEP